MKTLGIHILLEVFGCNYDILNDVYKIEKIMTKSAEIAKVNIIKSIFHKFNPHGISGIIVIAESHFSIHTWPEYGYAAIDVFTCSAIMDLEKAVKYLKENLKAKNIVRIDMKRGILEE